MRFSPQAQRQRDALLIAWEHLIEEIAERAGTLAAVDGVAVGAGMNLALGCDVRIVADEAKLATWGHVMRIVRREGSGRVWRWCSTAPT